MEDKLWICLNGTRSWDLIRLLQLMSNADNDSYVDPISLVLQEPAEDAHGPIKL